MKNSFKIVLLSFFFIACKNDKKQLDSSRPSIYSNQNHSDLFLDQKAITTFFAKQPENDNIKEQVNLFYKNRNFQFAWFNKKGMTAAMPNFYNQLQNYSNDFNDSSFKNSQLDTLITVIKTDATLQLDEKRKQELDVLLTTTFFKYSEKVYGGISKNPHELEWYIPRYKKNFQTLLDSLVITSKGTHEPVNTYYAKLKEKLKDYRSIQKKGGFPQIITTKKEILITESDSVIVKVKQRLFLSGDLKQNDNTIVFTDALVKAVSHFQGRVGLPENGKIDNKTITELNKTVDFRIKQMMVNLERLRWVPVEIEDDYLLVNIPEFKLHVFENKKLVWETNVVVGKEAKQTSIFKGNISRIILNPYWNVPNSIINNEILPKLKRSTSYLSRNNMEVLSGNTVVNPYKINWDKYKKNVPYTIRQKPGPRNSLGRIKFLFPNSFSIYLHDTPSKELFNVNKRDFSHGCIRVQNPKKLALYILRDDKDWDETKIDKIINKNKEYGIAIKPTIPVYIAYFTSWVDSNGDLNFRNDIYDLDEQLAKEIFSE